MPTTPVATILSPSGPLLMPKRPRAGGHPQNSGTAIRVTTKEGKLNSPDGRRTSVHSSKFLSHLAAELARTFGDQAAQTTYKIGYEWALQEMMTLARQIGSAADANSSESLWKLPRKDALERWWKPFHAAGWGSCSFDSPSSTGGAALIELRHGIVAAQTPGATVPTCHVYAGLFAGALSFLDVAECHAIEYQCVALGASDCRFVTASATRIDVVLSWLQSDVDPTEIRRRLG